MLVNHRKDAVLSGFGFWLDRARHNRIYIKWWSRRVLEYMVLEYMVLEYIRGVFGKRQRRSTEKRKHAIWPHGPAVRSSGNFNVNKGEDICLGRF